MKKILTLLFTALLGFGSVWGDDISPYHDDEGYYEETKYDVTYRINYVATVQSYGPSMSVITRNVSNQYATITAFDKTKGTISLVNSITINTMEMNGNPAMTSTLAVRIDKGCFLDYTGNIELPEYPTNDIDAKIIYYEGLSSMDDAYSNEDDYFHDVFNVNTTVFVPTDVDVSYYEQETYSYTDKQNYSRVFYPWEGHVTAKDSWTPPAEPSEPITSGTCGTNLNWEYGNYVLRLYRPDETQPATMSDFENNSESVVQVSSAPWYEYHDDIRVINLPEGLENIGDWAFFACSTLVANPTIPESVLSIGEESFAACASITEIDLPDGLTSIGNGAFRTCSSLAEIAIPSGVTTINFETFAYCTALKTVTFPETLTTIGNESFKNCEELVDVAFPSSLETIGNSAFAECFSLRSIVLPENLSSIGYDAFVTLGYTDETKGTLSTITMKGNTPPTLEETLNTYFITFSIYAFNGTIDVYVPAGSKDAYIAAWGTEKGDVMTQAQGRNYTFNYHEYGFDEDDKTGYFHDATSGVTASVIEELVSEAEQVHEVTIVRPIQANGKLNTICLPFALNASQIANSDLAGATIYAFTATDNATEETLLTLSPVNAMEAGVPYFFAYKNAAPDAPNLSKLVFREVLFSTATENPVDLGAGIYTLHGTLQPTLLDNEDNYLFLGANNAVFYPDLDGTTVEERTMKPFRAYFSVANQVAHAPARIVFGHQTTTSIENLENKDVATKIVKDGQIIIIRNNVRYNMAGQVIK